MAASVRNTWWTHLFGALMARNVRTHMIWTATQQHRQTESRTRSRPIRRLRARVHESPLRWKQGSVLGLSWGGRGGGEGSSFGCWQESAICPSAFTHRPVAVRGNAHVVLA